MPDFQTTSVKSPLKPSQMNIIPRKQESPGGSQKIRILYYTPKYENSFSWEVQHTFSKYPGDNDYHLGLIRASLMHRTNYVSTSRLSMPLFFLVKILYNFLGLSLSYTTLNDLVSHVLCERCISMCFGKSGEQLLLQITFFFL